MLKLLQIQNIILVQQATITFAPGLNILTGETGSGKSAIMHGLNLVIGGRTDIGVIRKGAEKGVIEAIFDLDSTEVDALLKEGGIDHDQGQELIIRRELSSSGKNRIFINNQAVQLSFLKKIAPFLVKMISQQASQYLYSTEYHRLVLDLYGELTPLVKQYQASYESEVALQLALEKLVKEESQRLREIDRCQKELQELQEAMVKEGEEEELFAEYTYLVNAEEIAEKSYRIHQALSGEKQPLVPLLGRQKQALEELLLFDESLQETVEAFQNALTELQEIARTLNNYQASVHYDANRLQFVSERLSLVNQIKKKYGPSYEEIKNYQEQLQEKLQSLFHADTEIETLQSKVVKAKEKSNHLAKELSEKRLHYAKVLKEALTQELMELNMSKALFEIKVLPQQRTKEGDDKVEFFLRPNVGENCIALKDGASGGEVSRVLLALQTLLAQKERPSSLVFDEVDANIGGKTAAVMGKKLKEMSRGHQVICITHFPQMAKCADHHLQISKEEKEGRTVTEIVELDALSKQKELKRMAGLLEQ